VSADSNRRTTASNAPLGSRHPPVVVTGCIVLLGFLTYTYVARLIEARSSAGSSWSVAALAGALCGIALIAAIVRRWRAKKVGALLVCPLVVVAACLLVTRGQLWSFLGGGGLITSPVEVAIFALCAVLYCAILGACLMLAAKTLAQKRRQQ
jgi:hypothetical protein